MYLDRICAKTEEMIHQIERLELASQRIPNGNMLGAGLYYKDVVIPIMDDLRSAADKLETMVCADYWPFPTYTELLFDVQQ